MAGEGRDVKTTAGVVQSSDPSVPITKEAIGYVSGSGLIIALAISWLRRRMSRDGSQIVQDKADGITATMLLNVNKALTVENERLQRDAREAWAKANADALELGRLRAQNEYLTAELNEAKNTITMIRAGVMAVGKNVDKVQSSLETTTKNVNSGFTPLN